MKVKLSPKAAVPATDVIWANCPVGQRRTHRHCSLRAILLTVREPSPSVLIVPAAFATGVIKR